MAEEKKSMSVDEVKTLHELLRLAIDDLKLCYADPDVEVDMGEWLAYDNETGICKVCLAGALLLTRGSLPSPVPGSQRPLNYATVQDEDIYPWMEALNNIRVGQLQLALAHIRRHSRVGPDPKSDVAQALLEWAALGLGTSLTTPRCSSEEMIDQLEQRYEFLKRHNL